MITQEYLKSILDYNSETGVFTWKIRKRGVNFGGEAGSYSPKGYHVIRIDYIQYQASILAWLWMTGEWPEDEIDHKDLNTSNTKWNNLRKATREQNNANRRLPKHNTIGAKGLFKNKSGNYTVRIQLNKKKINLGTYKTIEEAAKIYENAAKWYHGAFSRT